MFHNQTLPPLRPQIQRLYYSGIQFPAAEAKVLFQSAIGLCHVSLLEIFPGLYTMFLSIAEVSPWAKRDSGPVFVVKIV